MTNAKRAIKTMINNHNMPRATAEVESALTGEKFVDIEISATHIVSPSCLALSPHRKTAKDKKITNSKASCLNAELTRISQIKAVLRRITAM
jgi:hypothetical protein